MHRNRDNMPTPKVDELESPPVIGKSYLVKCIWGDTEGGDSRWLPIFGDPHVDDLDAANGDRDVAGVPHIHYDLRFFTNGDCYMTGWNYKDALVVKLNQGLKCIDKYNIRYRKREMIREWSLYLWESTEYLARFEQRYMDKKLDDCKKCPHWGTDLRGIPVIDGKILCPLHKLLWDAKDGSLVPTMQPDSKEKLHRYV